MAEFPPNFAREIGNAVDSVVDSALPEEVQRLINGPNTPPRTRTRTDYGATIHLSYGGRSSVVGGIYEFGENQTRDVRDYFAVVSNPDGLPHDVIGQNLTGRTIQVQRYDLWGDLLESVFGLSVNALLSEQVGVFDIRQQWQGPRVIPGSGLRQVWQWNGCKFQSFGRTISAGGDRIVKANASFSWRTKIAL